MYRIELSDDAVRSLTSLPGRMGRQIADKLGRISQNPRSCNAKPLQGRHRGYYRVRSGDYRVVFTVDDAARLVRVVGIFDRKDGYD